MKAVNQRKGADQVAYKTMKVQGISYPILGVRGAGGVAGGRDQSASSLRLPCEP